MNVQQHMDWRHRHWIPCPESMPIRRWCPCPDSMIYLLIVPLLLGQRRHILRCVMYTLHMIDMDLYPLWRLSGHTNTVRRNCDKLASQLCAHMWNDTDTYSNRRFPKLRGRCQWNNCSYKIVKKCSGDTRRRMWQPGRCLMQTVDKKRQKCR